VAIALGPTLRDRAYVMRVFVVPTSGAPRHIARDIFPPMATNRCTPATRRLVVMDARTVAPGRKRAPRKHVTWIAINGRQGWRTKHFMQKESFRAPLAVPRAPNRLVLGRKKNSFPQDPARFFWAGHRQIYRTSSSAHFQPSCASGRRTDLARGLAGNF